MSTSITLKKYDRTFLPIATFNLHGKSVKCPNCGNKVNFTRSGRNEITRAFCTNCQLIFEV